MGLGYGDIERFMHTLRVMSIVGRNLEDILRKEKESHLPCGATMTSQSIDDQPKPSNPNSHDQMPPISANHTPRNIPVPHAIQITLRHILRPPDLPRRHLRLELLHHIRPLVLRQPIPQLRLNSPRTDQVDPQRLQVQRQLPRQAVQARGVRADNTPVRDRMLGHRASGDGVAAPWPGTEVRREELAQEHWREEAHHARLLDEADVSIGDFDGCEGVACGENGVVERIGGVGSGLVEEAGEVGFESCFIG